MRKFMLACCVAVMLTCVSTVFAAPGGKGEKKPKDPAQMFKRLDANGDGKLTFEEFKGKRPEERAKKAFQRLDANNDGSLTQDEFKLPERKKKDA